MAQADALSARMARFRVGDRPAAERRPAFEPPRAAPAVRAVKASAPPVAGALALRPAEDDWEDF